LAQARDRSSYLLEHGLSQPEVIQVCTQIRDGLRLHPIGGGWWNTRPLPLLVAATEVGYDYQGTGTDFWPIFGERYGIAGHVDRHALSALFEREAARRKLAVPPDTAWNRAFCHIAWPVLHAVMPRELHRPFARCLRDVRVKLDLSAADASLIAPIRHRAQLQGSTRLIAWLEAAVPAAAITRFLLGSEESADVEPSALARIAADLASDESAIEALRSAKQRQKALETAPIKRTRAQALPIQSAPLVLRQQDGRFSLAVKLPQMEDELRYSTREALDALRWRALLWGTGRPVAARSLFSDHPLPLTPGTIPDEDAPIFPDLLNVPISPDALAFLSGLRVKSSRPLLFTRSEDGDHLQSVTRAASRDRRYFVVVGPDGIAPPAPVVRHGRLGSEFLFEVDASDAESRAWLEAIGIVVREPASLTWIGAPEVEQHRPIRRFRRGDLLAFEMSAPGSVTATLVAPDKERTSIQSKGRVVAAFVPAKKGQYSIAYGAGDVMPFEVIEPAEEDALLSVQLEASSASISELTDRTLSLRFDSSISVQETVLELKLLSHGRSLGTARMLLPDTPCRIGSEAPVWQDLVDEEVLERLLELEKVELRVRVDHILSETFSFERIVAPFIWGRGRDGQLTPSDEAGELAVHRYLASSPLLELASTHTGDDRDVILLRAGRGAPVAEGGVCVGPRSFRGAGPPPKPDRLPRRMQGQLPEMPGARAVVDSLIAWSSAAADHPITHFRRGQVTSALGDWSVEQLCGEKWRSREVEIHAHRRRAIGEAFVAACEARGAGFAPLPLTPTQHDSLRKTLVRLLEKPLARLSREIEHEPLTEDGGALLDQTFNEAYSELARTIEEVGDACPFDPDLDVDVGEPCELWEDALRAARSSSGFGGLVELLRPLGGGDELALADIDSMAPDKVVDLLADWMKRHGPPHLARSWTAELVEAAFWIFAKPSVAARLPWLSAVERMLADRFAARAIRYAALRSRSGAQAA
jgi:hypothetical protein